MEDLGLAAPVPPPRTATSLVRWLWPVGPGAEATAGDDGARWEYLGRILFVILLGVGFPIAMNRVLTKGCNDFTGFCDAGRYILEHGSRHPLSTLSRYWPSTDVPWIVFAYVPRWISATVWYVFSCATLVGLLNTICRCLLTSWDPAGRRRAALAAGLLAMPLALDGMCLGSFHILMVWLMIAGLDRATRGEAWWGGTLLGLAAWLKLLPFLGVGFLLLNRKTKAATIAVLVALSLDVVLSVGAFGLAGAWREHRIWWRDGAAGTASRQLTSPQLEDEDRLTNQSVAITLRRWLSSLGATPGDARSHLAAADLSATQLKMVFLGAMALAAAGVGAFCWPVRGGAWSLRTPEQIAMLALATLWFSPVVWTYHFIAAAPALAIILNRGRYRGLLIALVGIVWLGSLASLHFDVARAAGVLLWMSLLVGGTLALLRPPVETDAGGDIPDGDSPIFA